MFAFEQPRRGDGHLSARGHAALSLHRRPALRGRGRIAVAIRVSMWYSSWRPCTLAAERARPRRPRNPSPAVSNFEARACAGSADDEAVQSTATSSANSPRIVWENSLGLLRNLRRQAVLVLVEVLDRHDLGECLCVTVAIALQLTDRDRLVGGVLDLVFEAGIVGARWSARPCPRAKAALPARRRMKQARTMQSVPNALGLSRKDHSISMVMPLSFHSPSDAMKPS